MDENENKPLSLPDPTKPENPLARIAKWSGPIIIHKKCPVCNSMSKAAVEAMYDKDEGYSAIKAFLEGKGEAITIHQVKYHFQTHYKSQISEMALAEYADSMNEMMKRHRTMIDDMDHLIAACWMEFGRVAAMQTDGSMDKEQMRQKMLMDVARNIRETYSVMKTFQDGEAAIRATDMRFAKVWEIKLAEAKTPEEKDILIKTLRDFKEKLNQ
jgi:hypothetical protein